ncbi:dienelactone hydrolase family protein [Polynucleobacter kasalickyi]|uniref:Carboxymethylenebutenolidase n=1 Tax=Polynucleobacter kasalickyi TaxID=1938817 RepID=A0A1W2A1C9_9BURK|nr:dienelactone hydrolase family protein [Polynucleobacter kasalickyi]SMC54464.1 carboxymethylenebutenolidase [Polynucleobacter kasalickyi]
MLKNTTQDIEALQGKKFDEQLSRRDFIKTTSLGTLGVGFATCSDAIKAQAIKTDFEGIEAKEDTVSYQDSKLPIYVAYPKNAKGPLPLIIVISEIFGVHEYIADVTRRFAKLGYFAVAPEFFYRAGDPSSMGTMAELYSNIISKTPDIQVLRDIEAVIEWSKGKNINPNKIAVNGFCWGGRIVWLACERVEKITTGIAWYGRLSGEKSLNNPTHPIDGANQLSAPVLGLYGGKDTGIPTQQVEKMSDLLKVQNNNIAAKNSKFVIYPNSGHAFHADYRPSYNPTDAKLGWDEATKWLKLQGF